MWLRVPVALPKDQSSIPSIHMVAQQPSVISVPGELTLSSSFH